MICAIRPIPSPRLQAAGSTDECGDDERHKDIGNAAADDEDEGQEASLHGKQQETRNGHPSWSARNPAPIQDLEHDVDGGIARTTMKRYPPGVPS